MAQVKEPKAPKLEPTKQATSKPQVIEPHPLLGADIMYWNRTSNRESIYAIPGKLVRQNATDAVLWDLILFLPNRVISDRVAVRITDAPEDGCATLVK